jgi:hypothetical protein
MDHGCMRISTARKAIRGTQPIGTVALASPVCHDALDAEWLSIVKQLLEWDG